MNAWDQILQDKIAAAWTPDVRQTYRLFFDRVTTSAPLMVKVGKGGLSFYKQIESSNVFVCHFNAEPRKGEELGFADFRFDILQDYLDIDSAIQALKANAQPEVAIKVNKLWCSLHFPLDATEIVADLFTEHIIRKVQ